MSFTTNAPSGAPGHKLGRFRRIPGPGGATAEEQSSVYDNFYGQMPVPATQFATAVTALASLEDQPSVNTAQSNASVVSRANRRNGIVSTGGLQLLDNTTPQINKPVESSKFQAQLIGPHVNYVLNAGWYIAYPAATVMNGGRRNQALSTRVDQLVTRTSGGPGPATMRQAPRFKAVQTVPRYSTMPPSYPTASTRG